MFARFFQAACLSLAWTFAVSMISAMPFLVVSTISESLGRNVETSFFLGIAASCFAVSTVVIRPLLRKGDKAGAVHGPED